MKRIRPLTHSLFLFALLSLLPACAHYVHERPVAIAVATSTGVERSSTSRETPVTVGTNQFLVNRENSSSERPVMGSTQTMIGVERTSFNTFLMLGKASAIKSKVVSGDGYSRTLSVGNIEGQGDVEQTKAIGDIIGRAAGIAARTAAGLPPAP